MRNLSDWEGQMVRVEGFIEKSFLTNGLRTFLLEPVKVRTFNDADCTRHIDHLWVYDKTEKELQEQMSFVQEDVGIKFMRHPRFNEDNFVRLDKLMLIGKVHKYTRKNGTVDYGVERYVSLDLHTALERIKHFWHIKRYEVCLNVTNTLISAVQKDYIFIPIDRSVEQVKKELAQLNRNFTNAIEHERKMNEKAYKKHKNIAKRRKEWINLNQQMA